MATRKPLNLDTYLSDNGEVIYTRAVQEATINFLNAQRVKPSPAFCDPQFGCGEQLVYVETGKFNDKGNPIKLALNCATSSESQLSTGMKEKYGALVALVEVPSIGELEEGEEPKFNLSKWGSHARPGVHAKRDLGWHDCDFSKNRAAARAAEGRDDEAEARIKSDAMSMSPESENRPDPDGPDTTNYDREDSSLGLADNTENGE